MQSSSGFDFFGSSSAFTVLADYLYGKVRATHHHLFDRLEPRFLTCLDGPAAFVDCAVEVRLAASIMAIRCVFG